MDQSESRNFKYFENGDYNLIYKSEKEVTVTMFELQNQHSMKSTAQFNFEEDGD